VLTAAGTDDEDFHGRRGGEGRGRGRGDRGQGTGESGS